MIRLHFENKLFVQQFSVENGGFVEQKVIYIRTGHNIPTYNMQYKNSIIFLLCKYVVMNYYNHMMIL